MGMKHNVWKLMASPVAAAKSSRLDFSLATAPGAALQIMRVLSAYWSTRHGVLVETGLESCPMA
jgi:hypothetical protein